MSKEWLNIGWQLKGYEFWLVVGVSLILLCFLLIQAWQRPNKKYRIARLFCSSLLVFALVMIGLKPATKIVHQTKAAIILTEHYKASIVDSLRKTEDSVLIFHYQQAKPEKQQGWDSKEIFDLQILKRNQRRLGKLHIVGNGIPTQELALLKEYQTHFYLNREPDGFGEVSYLKEIQVQDPLEVKGGYKNDDKKKVTLVLASPGGAVDSTLLSTENETFTLTDKPKEAGKYLYSLIAKNEKGDTLNKEVIPVIIHAKRKLRVVVINNFPRYETKYLKNWLGEEGHSVAVRSIISKNKVKDEFVNQSPITFRLTQTALKQIDLLILDSEYAQSLVGTALRNVQQAIQNQGLGLLIQIDETGAVPVSLAKFPLAGIQTTKTSLSGSSFGQKGNFELNQLPYLLQPKMGTLALVRNTQGQTLVGYNIKGLGGVGVSLVEESYQMLLEGKSRFYAAYWSHILNRLAKKQNALHQWRVDTKVPIINEECKVTLATNLVKPIGEVYDRDRTSEFYLQNQINFPQKWSGSFRPYRAGWQQLAVKGDTTTNNSSFYVYDESGWKNLRDAQLIKTNRQWAKKHPKPVAKNTKATITHYKPIPLWYFFIIFLLSAGFLWLEPKL